MRVLPGTPVYGSTSTVKTTWKEVVHSEDEKIVCYFDHIKEHLVRHIQKADCIIGCVAWLTSKDVLTALQGKLVSIIVQKEDFLRPDEFESANSTKEIQKLYRQLTPVRRDQLPSTALDYCAMGDLTWSKEGSIRCVGHCSGRKGPSSRMHHKFVIFCRRQGSKMVPYSVWTGSFNFSETASKCAENAIVLSDKNLIDGYVQEYGSIAAISEPLNWTSPYCAPQHHIGVTRHH